MSDFEQRIATREIIDDRYERLKKLDPKLAKTYLFGIDKKNKELLQNGEKLHGFGMIGRSDVDAILAEALDNNDISAAEEEALMIIINHQTQWAGDSKQYMIGQIEANLDKMWSTNLIDDEVSTLLRYATDLNFTSAGTKHIGTGIQYTPREFLMIEGLVKDLNIGLFEVRKDRSFKRTSAGKHGAWGFYDSVTNDIYIVTGLGALEKQAVCTHLAVHAIQDFKNIAENQSLAKFAQADAYIAQAYVALKQNSPYTSEPRRPETVACRTKPTAGAAQLLLTPVRSRDKAWNASFKAAYDDVVDAFAALPKAGADDILNPLESEDQQKAEGKLVKDMLKNLKKQTKTTTTKKP